MNHLNKFHERLSKKIKVIENEIGLLQFHSSNNFKQRHNFKSDIGKLKQNQFVVVINFKENLNINGVGPVQTTSNYYIIKQVSCIGICIYKYNLILNKIEKNNYKYLYYHMIHIL